MTSNLENQQNSLDPQGQRAQILWHSYLTGDRDELDSMTRTVRKVFKRLPSAPRCLVCNAPFHGVGSLLLKPLGFAAGYSSLNPTLCDRCEKIVKK